MDVPDCEFGNNGTFLFADCGLNQDPTAEELAAIADSSAKSYRALVEKPVIAMLSHSTRGSAHHTLVDKVVKATEMPMRNIHSLISTVNYSLMPLSFRKLLNPKRKTAKLRHANVLIFPNLDCGNIGYKLVQRLAKAEAYGPRLQGIARPVNDLSRGCSAEDIVGVVALTAVQAQMS